MFPNCIILNLILLCKCTLAIRLSERYRSKNFDYEKSYDNYLGCYKSTVGGVGVEEYNAYKWEDGKGEMNPTDCVNRCVNAEFTFSILTRGNICVCGHNHPKAAEAPDESCNDPCSGNPAMNCGGSGYNSIFQNCIPGHYGKSCEMLCMCEFLYPCNIMTGLCLNSVCREKFIGDRCDQEKVTPGKRILNGFRWLAKKVKSFFITSEDSIPKECDPGRFGMYCLVECYCARNVACDRITGICSRPACKDGWMGGRCDKADPCADKPCQNGGTCSNKYFEKNCLCVTGWAGDNCEILDPCIPNPCKFGGGCSVLEARPLCSCLGEYTGDTCEIDGSKISLVPTYMGCMRDGNPALKEDRDLPKVAKEVDSNLFTPDKCIRRCKALMYTFAGVQNGKECYCGNSFGLLGAVPESFCRIKCSGNLKKNCGGRGANSVFAVCPRGTYKYDCSGKCNCLGANFQCDFMSGKCPTPLCMNGFEGDMCDKDIPDGRKMLNYYYKMVVFLIILYLVACISLAVYTHLNAKNFKGPDIKVKIIKGNTSKTKNDDADDDDDD